MQGAADRGPETSRHMNTGPPFGSASTVWTCPPPRESRAFGSPSKGVWAKRDRPGPAGGEERDVTRSRVVSCFGLRSRFSG